MLTSSVQSSLVVTRVGDMDVTSLTQHMQKPASAVVMTFSADPYFGMTTESFTFAPHRRAALGLQRYLRLV